MSIFEAITKSTDTVLLDFLKRNYRLYTPFTADITGQKNIIIIFLEIVHKIYEQFAKINKENPKFVQIVGGRITYLLLNEEGIVEYETANLES